MKASKRIGILTSGGDCAGLNAVIRAVVHRATLTYGWEVLGVKEGTQGLLYRPVHYQNLGLSDVDGNMMRLGGTILGTTNRGDPFAYPIGDGTLKDRSDEIIGGYRELGLDALIGIGGDGSFAILHRLAEKGGFNLIGIPKTIDNDLGLTEVSVGYDTAVGVAVEALDRLQPTAASHERVMVLEVMGRDAGHIALAAGIAGGADVILIPEVAYSIEAVAAKIKQVKASGRNFALVVVSEAVRRHRRLRRRKNRRSDGGGNPRNSSGPRSARVPAQRHGSPDRFRLRRARRGFDRGRQAQPDGCLVKSRGH